MRQDGIIGVICLNYWCDTPTKKQIFLRIINENEEKYQEKLRTQHNIDNIFKNKNNRLQQNELEINTNEIIRYKESAISIIVKKIKEYFKRNL